MLFANTQLVARIERTEALSLAAIVAACHRDTFAIPLGAGFALFNRAQSPLNKVVGVGFESIDPHELTQIEQRYHARQEPIQIELSTHADPALSNLLVARGYRFSGFENVLGCALDVAARLEPHSVPELSVRRARKDELDDWIAVLVAGASQLAGDEQLAAHDVFAPVALERVFRDMGQAPDIERWLAFRGSTLAGGATLSVRDGVAQLFGAATHPAHRRRGVQSALLAARLAAASERDCDIAVVTTQPGSQSQHNVQRSGFVLLYARAIWQLDPAQTSMP